MRDRIFNRIASAWATTISDAPVGVADLAAATGKGRTWATNGSASWPNASHADPRTTMRYYNSRELHGAVEKPQVSRSRQGRDGVPCLRTALELP